ncbi:uncharacterized protein CMC5_008090 [Chondromyces crocatus]|uniref:Uncharacterized protein n=1 Tax=Chondromyces crocatus TaxID=52 RepID=A0A0K1E7Z7_CHOCO|nr:uncharacterized protein CMC5_008090 [Chondromyces crocatus]
MSPSFDADACSRKACDAPGMSLRLLSTPADAEEWLDASALK